MKQGRNKSQPPNHTTMAVTYRRLSCHKVPWVAWCNQFTMPLLLHYKPCAGAYLALRWNSQKANITVHSTRLKTCEPLQFLHGSCEVLVHRLLRSRARFVCLGFESYYLRGSAWRNPNYMTTALSANTHFITDNDLSRADNSSLECYNYCWGFSEREQSYNNFKNKKRKKKPKFHLPEFQVQFSFFCSLYKDGKLLNKVGSMFNAIHTPLWTQTIVHIAALH